MDYSEKKIDWIMVDLYDLKYDSNAGNASLMIHYNEEIFSISTNKVILFNFSTSSEDIKDGFIADVTISEYKLNDCRKVLESCGYKIYPVEYPMEIFHLHAEASIVLDIISESNFEIKKITDKS